MWPTDNITASQPTYAWTPAGWLPTATSSTAASPPAVPADVSVFRSPAALEPTAFLSLPVAGRTAGPSVIDAIVAALVGSSATAVETATPVAAPGASPAAAVDIEVPSPRIAPYAGVGAATAGVARLARAAGSVPADTSHSDGNAVGDVPNVRRAVLGYSSSRVRSVAHGTRRKVMEIWAGRRDPRTVHVSQVPSKFNPRPTPGNRDCGPASVVMALRMVGVDIPGVATASAPQRLINRVRKLAGNTNSGSATTNFELERALARSGVTTREINDADSIKDAIVAGRPVILNGNPRHAGAYGWKFSASQMLPYNGGHWIVVSGWDERSHTFIINDPLSTIGAVKVTPGQLEAYRGGSLGIEVSR